MMFASTCSSMRCPPRQPVSLTTVRRHPLATAAASSSRPPCAPTWDVVGFGQAMVDFSCAVDDTLLQQHSLTSGQRRVITVDQRQALLESLDGADYEITPGGSLANSLVAYAMLNDALMRCMPLASPPSPVPTTRRPPAVAFTGPLGCDAMGQYFLQQMRDRSVHVLHGAAPDAATGTVAVLTTPDAQRSFLSYLGSGEPLDAHAPTLARHLPSTRLLLVEGYLWEAVDGPSAIYEAAKAARDAGARVALTCGDAGIVARHAAGILQLLRDGLVDVLFANKAEALALLAHQEAAALIDASPSTPADACAMALGSLTDVVLVTDGANGAAVVQRGADGQHELHIVPPCWQKDPPADTNGAGDAFAGAFLFGWLGGIGVRRAGRLAARTAAAVITRPGATLTQHEAKRVVLESFGLCTASEEDVAVGASLELGWQM